ncbi:MAG: beta strand repeat-containing protein, partial [Candidatus Paceibacteria bacterium]
TLSSGSDQLSIDDNYLFNDGDTATGNYNFGSGDIFVDDSENKVSLGTSATSTNEDINIDGTVNISGQQYPTTDGSSGQALTTDGSGALSFGNIDKNILANNGTLGFDWGESEIANNVTADDLVSSTSVVADSEVDNDLTINSSGSVATSSLDNDDFLQNDGDTATGNYNFTSGNLAVNSSSADTALEVSGDIKNSGNITSTNIYPNSDNSFQLGSSNNRWSNIYAVTTTIGDTITIDKDDIISSNALSISSNSGNITISPSSDVVMNGLTYPSSDGTANQVITTDGSGNLSVSNVNKGVLANNGTLSYDWQDSEVADSITAENVVTTSAVISDKEVEDSITAENIATSTSVISDTEVDDNISIGSSGSVNDSALSSNVSLLGQNIEDGEVDNNITVNTSSLASDDFLQNDGDIGTGSYGLSNALFTRKANDRVGIGESNPQYVLDVADQARISAGSGSVGSIGSSDYALSLQNNANQTWLEILNNGGTGKGAFFGLDGDAFEQWNYQGGPITFYTDTGYGSGQERLRIANSGEIGINETNPQYQLDVKGQGRMSGGSGQVGTSNQSDYVLSLQNNTTQSWLEILNSTGTNKGALLGLNNDNFEHKNKQGGAITFHTGQNAGNTSERMRITNTGNVGINTTSPDTALEVRGDVTVSSGAKLITRSTSDDDVAFEFVEASGNSFQISDANLNDTMLSMAGSDLIRFQDQSQGTTYFETKAEMGDDIPLAFGNVSDSVIKWNDNNKYTNFDYDKQNKGNTSFRLTQNGTVRLIADSNGNIGINTTSPDYNLEING